MRRLFVLLTVGLVSAAVELPVAARTASQDAASQQSSSQDASVADAARRNRDKKKNPSPSSKSSKVLTDDDLVRKSNQPGQDVLNLGASPTPETESADSKPAASAEAANETSQKQAKDAAEQEAQIAKLKLEITEAENGLDFARRQLALDQDSYFSQTDYARDTAGKAKLDDEKQGVSDRQQKIEKLKSRLAVLEESKGGAKNERSRAPEPTQTQEQPSTPPRL
jgi:hypothetical protein